MQHRLTTVVITLIVVALSGQPSFAAREYPAKPLNNTVVWGAGGGTDVVNRLVMTEMSKILGKRIQVSNKPGGVAGSIGMNHVINKRPDGYSLVGIASSNVTAAVQGGWPNRIDVWSHFIFGGSPEVISVPAQSPIKTLEELIQAANSMELKVSASGAGSIHHLYVLELMKETGVKLQFIPYPGSTPSQTAAITGEVDVVVTSMAEQAALVKGGQLRPLAMLDPRSFHLKEYGDIPSAFQTHPSLATNLPIPQAIGFAVSNKAPIEVKNKLADAFEEAIAQPAVRKWAEENYYVITGETGDEARITFDQLESLFSWSLYDLGSSKFSPEKFGIPKP